MFSNCHSMTKVIWIQKVAKTLVIINVGSLEHFRLNDRWFFMFNRKKYWSEKLVVWVFMLVWPLIVGLKEYWHNFEKLKNKKKTKAEQYCKNWETSGWSVTAGFTRFPGFPFPVTPAALRHTAGLQQQFDTLIPRCLEPNYHRNQIVYCSQHSEM